MSRWFPDLIAAQEHHSANDQLSHKVVLPIRAPILIATCRHRFLRKQIIVRMISLPRLLLPLPCKPQLLLLPRLLRPTITVAEFLESIFALLVQVGIFFGLGLVEPVYGRVHTSGNMYALDLFSLSFEIWSRLNALEETPETRARM